MNKRKLSLINQNFFKSVYFLYKNNYILHFKNLSLKLKIQLKFY